MNGLQTAICAAVALTACATPEPTDDRRAVLTSVELATSPERAVSAFLERDDLAGWWQVSRSLVDPTPGGTWAITWDDYGPEHTDHVWTGVIAEVAPRRLVIDDLVMIEPGRPLFAPLRLEITATAVADGCRLEVAHRGYGRGPDWDWIHDVVVHGWQHVLGDLRTWFAADSAARRG